MIFFNIKNNMLLPLFSAERQPVTFFVFFQITSQVAK